MSSIKFIYCRLNRALFNATIYILGEHLALMRKHYRQSVMNIATILSFSKYVNDMIFLVIDRNQNLMYIKIIIEEIKLII